MSNHSVVLVSKPLWELNGLDWDAFAGMCDAPYTSGYEHLRAQALMKLGRQSYYPLEIWDDRVESREKVGQCVVAAREGLFQIEDRLQLVPSSSDLWPAAMEALLRYFGPGTYRYGGTWSCEPSREGELRDMAGVRIVKSQSFAVQSVDFARWPSWDSYWATVSDSVRYESKYAPMRVSGLVLRHFCGVDMLRGIPALVRLQKASMSRKRLPFRAWKYALRHAYYMLLCRRSLRVVLAEADTGVLAGFCGAQMGRNLHYLFGGQRAGNSGANWYLLRELVRAAYEQNSQGRFLMGRVDYSIHDEKIGGGLLRSRRALRVTDHQTAIIDFIYERS